jgi:hypothetical protein
MIEAAASEREAFEAKFPGCAVGRPNAESDDCLAGWQAWQARAALSQQTAPAEPVATSWIASHESGRVLHLGGPEWTVEAVSFDPTRAPWSKPMGLEVLSATPPAPEAPTPPAPENDPNGWVMGRDACRLCGKKWPHFHTEREVNAGPSQGAAPEAQALPTQPDRAWFQRVAVLARVWPEHDEANVPAAIVGAIQKYHSAMLAASPKQTDEAKDAARPQYAVLGYLKEPFTRQIVDTPTQWPVYAPIAASTPSEQP